MIQAVADLRHGLQNSPEAIRHPIAQPWRRTRHG
jgi:hypothetical protein